MDLLTVAGRALRCGVVVAILAWSAIASADLFSPGPLARPHTGLEGLSKCALCHSSGSGLTAALCLDCHAELAVRVRKKKGLHGRLPPEKQSACQGCHLDHKGLDFKMVDWERGREAFDHRRTGWPLAGKHAKVRCEDCHQSRLIEDPAIGKLLKEQPRRVTYLGLGTKCVGCHFDEHRGQLARECEKCHDEVAWKPQPRFDHGKSDFPLRGRHRQVNCIDCHPFASDDAPHAGFPRPRADTFLTMKPIDHESCETCHEDPHQGSFGTRCESCHVEQGWKVIKTGSGKSADFHDKTRFPLRGGHIGVECRSCHGPFPGQKAIFRGLAFSSCTDCHADAHVGQLGARPPFAKLACEPCHSVNRFFPAAYELEQHAATKFPLEGGHLAAACRGCHPVDDRLASRVPAAVKKELKRKARPELFSFAVLKPKKAPELCAGCHADVHLGQLQTNPPSDNCRRCHKPSAFSELIFDHDKDSRFPLTGKHAKAPCAACHRPERFGAKTAVRYRPLEMACGACHADYHLGQLTRDVDVTRPGARVSARPGPKRDCDFCHGTEAFKKTHFDHNDARFTSYPLEGKHAKAPCAGCHPKVVVAGDVKTERYRPLSRECEACHVDYHHGDFRGLEP